jgi:Zn-dependent metalloprotease
MMNMINNGLDSFSLHSEDSQQGPTLAAINEELATSSAVAPLARDKLDPETAARQYLTQLIESPQIPALADEGVTTEYRTLSTETVPLTDSTVVKFEQVVQKIPVYGSLVSIELDQDNSMLAVNTALGAPTDVDSVAKLSPADAQEIIIGDAGEDALPLTTPPTLNYYYDTKAEKWRLVYIATNVPRRGEHASTRQPTALPEVFDYVVDAHSGELVTKLSRTQSIVWTPEELDIADELGNSRRVRAERDENGNTRLVDSERRIETYDFEFRRIELQRAALPGAPVANPPQPWSSAAVSAHANAQQVADYLFHTLKRNGLDGAGGRFISSINCRSIRDNTPKQWRNAAWIGTQMVYGQRMIDGRLRSYAAAIDVVAHEMTHGLTDHTAGLQYQDEPGALNESYSDIFGIIIANAHEDDIEEWDWEMGEDLSGTGIPLRDISDPPRRGQPDHMNDYLATEGDFGGVHTNSGIHNKAAFNIITAKDGEHLLFTPQEVSALFYLALTQRLAPTSGFSTSRDALELSAKSLFRRSAQAVKAKKLAAISKAFDDVGIPAPN